MEDFQTLLTGYAPVQKTPIDISDRGDWYNVKTMSGQWITASEADHHSISMETFITALRFCKIADTNLPVLPGAFCFLPNGVQMQHRFQKKVREVYDKYELNEYDYPMTVSTHNLKDYIKEMNIKNSLVHASINTVPNDNSWTLTPTGESIIYPHWKAMLKQGEPLPFSMYRYATYFRPKKGKHTESIFRCAESNGIFEFHCAYENKGDSSVAFKKLILMLKELLDSFQLPYICSNRPLSTNNYKVSKTTIGFDIPLPTGKTIQLASLYYQDDLLSEIFNLRVSQKQNSDFTSHVTGYISRRTLLVQLLLGLTTSQYFIIPPEMQPIQVALLIKGESVIALQQTAAALSSKGIRVALHMVESGKNIQNIRKRFRQMCTAIDVIILTPTGHTKPYKIIITRYDTEQEKVFFTKNLDRLADEITDAVHLCDAYYNDRISLYGKQKNVYCDNIEAVGKVIKKGMVAVCALGNNVSVLTKLESLVSAEILGFSSASAPGNCIVTNTLVFTLAFVSRRI